MTITCPACDATFKEPDAEVIRSRALQCGKCEHEWWPTHHRITCDAPAMMPELEELQGEPVIRTNLPVVSASTQQDAGPVAAVPALAERRIIDRPPAPVEKLSFTQFGLPMIALAFATFAAGSVVFKDAVMAKLPQTVAYYQAAGLASQTPGLTIANVSTAKTTKDGIARLIVKGEVQNIADATVPVPPLEVVMRNAANSNLYAWTVTATKDELKAGEVSRFTAIAHDVPNNAAHVDVKFVSRND